MESRLITDSSRIGRLEMELGQVRHDFGEFRDTLLQEFKKLHRGLGQLNDSLLRRQGTPQQEGINGETAGLGDETETEGNDTIIRLRFCCKLEPRVYQDDEIKSIKLAIFDGDRIIESGPMSELKIEVLALVGDFPYKANDSWTSKEFNDYIARGRDGKGNVLVGKGTNTQLSNGECHVASIRFKEGSCRVHNRMFIVGARVCDGQAIRGRVQEDVTNPVVVLDRRNKCNEKSYPPKPDDEVHHLESICKNGVYCKKLEKQNIHTVEHFLKALYKDENNLRNSLDIKPKSKIWNKMVSHAKTCCLKDKPELKLYLNKEKSVVLFFNYVHRLVGARFDSQYVAFEGFDQTQKNLVNMLKKNAYDQLDGLTGDHVLKDNIPVPIYMMNTDGGARPSRTTSSEPQQTNSGHHSAEHQDELEGIRESKVARLCSHGPNSIRDRNSAQNNQVEGIPPRVEGSRQGLLDRFAVWNNAPCLLTAPNNQWAWPGHDLQASPSAQTYMIPQLQQLFNGTGAPVVQPVEMQRHAGWPGHYDTLQASPSAQTYMIPQLQLLNGTDAAPLPNYDTMGSSVSAQQQWS